MFNQYFSHLRQSLLASFFSQWKSKYFGIAVWYHRESGVCFVINNSVYLNFWDSHNRANLILINHTLWRWTNFQSKSLDFFKNVLEKTCLTIDRTHRRNNLFFVEQGSRPWAKLFSRITSPRAKVYWLLTMRPFKAFVKLRLSGEKCSA